MRVVEIAQIENAFVIHFDTDDTRINAYTFASTIIALADAAKAANASLNPGSQIEVVVEALGPGSFRAQIRALYSRAKNLFSNQVIAGVVIGVIGNYIYERTLAVDDKVVVEVKTDEVIIQRGQDRVVVPRQIYDATRQVERNPQFVKSINKSFAAMAADDKINGIGLVSSMDAPPPPIPIPRETLIQLAAALPEDPNSRVVTEEAELQIVRAILKKSNRRWEFVWRGVTISAPVLHEGFYREFFAHEITIAPGDTLRVTLAIKQSRDPETGIYTNVGYEILEVHEHVPRVRQMPLEPDGLAA
ncbi:MAG: hypothetical protein ACT6UH_20545 [Hydrogenophaga sp.]|uniref:hypothetical protein n=1 Tax=Hydrogenophaga sp. TaxID=1904254 RepID=UPI0040366DA1